MPPTDPPSFERLISGLSPEMKSLAREARLLILEEIPGLVEQDRKSVV